MPSAAPAAPETKTTDTESPKATAVAATPAAPAAEPLAVIATNGALANGHAANGNGHAKANGNGGGSAPAITLNLGANTKVSFQTQADAPSCMDCGSIMVRNGSCYKCLNCGSTSGCKLDLPKCHCVGPVRLRDWWSRGDLHPESSTCQRTACLRRPRQFEEMG